MIDESIPDPPLNAEQARVASSLIDAELMSHARRRSCKVAMLVGRAMNNEAIRVPGLPDLYYSQRVRALVEKGELIAEGHLDFMRFSEVRLP